MPVRDQLLEVGKVEMSEDRGDTWEEVVARIRVELDLAYGPDPHNEKVARAALAAALAPPTKPCEMCGGVGQRYDDTDDSIMGPRWERCVFCDASGRVPDLDAPRLRLVKPVGWCAPTHTRKYGYVLNVEPIDAAGEQPVFIEVVPEEPASDGGNDHE